MNWYKRLDNVIKLIVFILILVTFLTMLLPTMKDSFIYQIFLISIIALGFNLCIYKYSNAGGNGKKIALILKSSINGFLLIFALIFLIKAYPIQNDNISVFINDIFNDKSQLGTLINLAPHIVAIFVGVDAITSPLYKMYQINNDN